MTQILQNLLYVKIDISQEKFDLTYEFKYNYLGMKGKTEYSTDEIKRPKYFFQTQKIYFDTPEVFTSGFFSGLYSKVKSDDKSENYFCEMLLALLKVAALDYKDHANLRTI